MKKTKPTPEQILKVPPLTWGRSGDPFLACNVCGDPFDFADLSPALYREHDEHDRPIAGDGALVFLGRGADHLACSDALTRHPRLYGEETGAPGHFPALCGECVHRRGFACTHPDLSARATGATRRSDGPPTARGSACLESERCPNPSTSRSPASG